MSSLWYIGTVPFVAIMRCGSAKALALHDLRLISEGAWHSSWWSIGSRGRPFSRGRPHVVSLRLCVDDAY